MRITPVNNTNFKAVNQKYYNWAKKEMQGACRLGELTQQLSMDVAWGDIHPQDGIDTIKAIIKLTGRNDKYFKHVLECFEITKKSLEKK